uniref:Tripartite motif containing 4 n=1 Tax=Equus caballus TaxID=9796 RepID=A0A3Q2LCS9_HORSE
MPRGQASTAPGGDPRLPVSRASSPQRPRRRVAVGSARAPAGSRTPEERLRFPLPWEAPTATPALGQRSGMEAEDLQEELTCSICLDYFEDPVSIECGHNFCRGCLHRSWAPGGRPFPCPECRQLSSPAALRPNWALARLTEKTRRRRQGPVPPGVCGRHWEPLRLFCEDDQRPVCLVCRESQEHQGHSMAPIDEAFESYRNPKDVLTRSENQDVNYSLEVLKVKTVCRIPMMKEMLKRFQVAVNPAEDTAHPKLIFSQDGRYVKNGASASSWPLFSTAWSYFTGWRNPQKPTQFAERFQHLPCVLGKNVFASGKHYWEVENRDSLEIAVGVCREDIMGIVDSSKVSPNLGIWAICWSPAGCRPLTSFPVSPTKQEPALQRVGVFLDYGAGEVSFYNAVDGVHLHTFSCSFASCLRPFFWLSPLASLVIPSVTGGK